MKWTEFCSAEQKFRCARPGDMHVRRVAARCASKIGNLFCPTRSFSFLAQATGRAPLYQLYRFCYYTVCFLPAHTSNKPKSMVDEGKGVIVRIPGKIFVLQRSDDAGDKETCERKHARTVGDKEGTFSAERTSTAALEE